MKILALVSAALAAVLLAAGCGGSSSSSSSSTSTTNAGIPTDSSTTAPKSIKVGLVTDIGQLNDRGFNHLAFVGLQRAEKQLGVSGRVLESPSGADYIPNLTTLAQQNYDLVIAVGFLQGDAVNAVSQKFPKTHFAIIDVDRNDLKSKPKNVVGLLFKEQEVGYLAGYVAALEAKKAGKTVISSVGGQKSPPVDRFIAGYQAGAKKAYPAIKTLNAYSQDFVDQAKCKEIALDQIAHGSEVVFQVAGGCGLGALDAAKEKGVWGIGVDADQGFLGPHVLTSAQKKVDVSVFDMVKDVQSGRFPGGTNLVFGLDKNGVGLGRISPKADKGDAAAAAKIRSEIIDGTISGIPTVVK